MTRTVTVPSWSRYKWTIVLFLLFFGWLIAMVSVQGDSLTTDEAYHFDYGRSVLEGRVNPVRPGEGSKMLVSALNVLPVYFLKPYAMTQPMGFNNFETVRAARHVTLIFSVVLALLVYLWAEALYGARAGFLALILYDLSPLVLAHRRYVTHDLYAALMFVAVLYSLWSFEKKGGRQRGVRTAILIGLAQVVKFSSVWLFPITAMIMLLQPPKTEKGWRDHLKHTVLWMGIFGLVSVFVINATYGFRGSFQPIGKYPLQSSGFRQLANHLPSSLPVPLPQEWVLRFDDLMAIDEYGRFGPIYLLEQFQESNPRKGFKGYFFWAYLFKEPIGAQLLLLVAFLFYLKRRKDFDFRRDELFLVVPFLCYGIYLNYFLRAQIGLRYALPLFPLIYIFTSSLLKRGEASSRKFKIFLEAMLFYILISVASYFPFFLPYFNEIVWDRSQAYKYLLDSNLAWGIDQNPRLQEYLRRYPKEPTFFNPEDPVKGRVILDLFWGYLVNPKREKLKWFMDHYKPVAHVGYFYWIYEIP